MQCEYVLNSTKQAVGLESKSESIHLSESSNVINQLGHTRTVFASPLPASAKSSNELDYNR